MSRCPGGVCVPSPKSQLDHVLAVSQFDRISKHLEFVNLVQGNLLHRAIFISNIQVNV